MTSKLTKEAPSARFKLLFCDAFHDSFLSVFLSFFFFLICLFRETKSDMNDIGMHHVS